MTCDYDYRAAAPLEVAVQFLDEATGLPVAQQRAQQIPAGTAAPVSALPAPADLLPDYLLVSPDTVYVEVDENGQSATPVVTFLYRYVAPATEAPTPVPTEVPTPVPTEVPTPVPTEVPTPIPTDVPTPVPTEVPTPVPTEVPTPVPTEVPTPIPTDAPTPVPTDVPAPVPATEFSFARVLPDGDGSPHPRAHATARIAGVCAGALSGL